MNDKNFIIQKESRLKSDREKDVDSLNKIIKEKDREIQKLLDDSDFLQNEKQKLYEDNTRMFNEIDRLKKHIYIITDQNQQVIFYFMCKKNFSFATNWIEFKIKMKKLKII